MTKQTGKYVKKGAVVGIEGLQAIAYDTIAKFYKSSFPSVDDIKEARGLSQRFDDVEKAMDYLVED